MWSVEGEERLPTDSLFPGSEDRVVHRRFCMIRPTLPNPGSLELRRCIFTILQVASMTVFIELWPQARCVDYPLGLLAVTY